MATKTWVGGAGAWDDAADWSPPGEPGIGDDAVIGAGSVVTRDVPAGMGAVGSPARVVRAIDGSAGRDAAAVS